MDNMIFSPPLAFIVNLLLVSTLVGIGRVLAGPANLTPGKSSTYSSGEVAPTDMASPGYRPFFVLALFFGVLHLGVLVIASSNFSSVGTIYLIGLIFTLCALILG
jgi:NADH:ubiquinone oxidoreductase subunit 3 (subunit A)